MNGWAIKERERFEAWAEINCPSIERWTRNKEHYEDNRTELAWEAWVAACVPITVQESAQAGNGEVLYVCRASGEGSANFRLCRTAEEVFAFEDKMFGARTEGDPKWDMEHFLDAANWTEYGEYECDMYCATFTVWKVPANELNPPASAGTVSDEALNIAQAVVKTVDVDSLGKYTHPDQAHLVLFARELLRLAAAKGRP